MIFPKSIDTSDELVVKHEMITNEPGTLVKHGVSFKGGQRFQTWKTGPIKGREEYSIGRHGELRHTFPQFKGSKKDRLKFRKALKIVMAAPTPAGYVELKPEDKIVALDLLANVMTGLWEPTPYIDCTLDQLTTSFMVYPRACRKVKCDGDHGMPFCADPNCWQGSATQCCSRDHDHDGNCDRHPAPPQPQLEDKK